jgi:hypothetical protein
VNKRKKQKGLQYSKKGGPSRQTGVVMKEEEERRDEMAWLM